MYSYKSWEGRERRGGPLGGAAMAPAELAWKVDAIVVGLRLKPLTRVTKARH